MRIGFALALFALVACAPQPSKETYRDRARPISSMAVIEPAQLDGTWAQVAGFGPGCGQPGALTISAQGRQISGMGCDLPLRGEAAMVPSGPGRFQINGQEFWLIWADFDYRTLVFGTPSGAFGAILNRGGPIPSDRLEAARRVLSFNGYDLGKLQLRQ